MDLTEDITSVRTVIQEQTKKPLVFSSRRQRLANQIIASSRYAMRRIMFHGTSMENASSIIRTEMHSKAKRFSEESYNSGGLNLDNIVSFEGVYLTPRLKLALKHGREVSKGKGGFAVIVAAVETKEMALDEDVLPRWWGPTHVGSGPDFYNAWRDKEARQRVVAESVQSFWQKWGEGEHPKVQQNFHGKKQLDHLIGQVAEAEIDFHHAQIAASNPASLWEGKRVEPEESQKKSKSWLPWKRDKTTMTPSQAPQKIYEPITFPSQQELYVRFREAKDALTKAFGPIILSNSVGQESGRIPGSLGFEGSSRIIAVYSVSGIREDLSYSGDYGSKVKFQRVYGEDSPEFLSQIQALV